jgi:hypothetical protein
MPGPSAAATSRPPATKAATLPGTAIYFEQNSEATGGTVYRLNHGVVTKVATLADSVSYTTDDLAISADGQRVAWVDPGVHVANVDGTDVRTLDTAPAAWLNWSPDSRQVVYERHVGEKESINVINADGSGSRELAASGQYPTWSVDGRWIAYTNSKGLMVMRADGTAKRHVPVPRDTISNVAQVGNDAKLIVLATHRAGRDYAPSRFGADTVVDGTTGKKIDMATRLGQAGRPVLTPSGNVLLVVPTSTGETGDDDMFALELRAADGRLLARQAVPPELVNAGLIAYTEA